MELLIKINLDNAAFEDDQLKELAHIFYHLEYRTRVAIEEGDKLSDYLLEDIVASDTTTVGTVEVH